MVLFFIKMYDFRAKDVTMLKLSYFKSAEDGSDLGFSLVPVQDVHVCIRINLSAKLTLNLALLN